jgi:hypothetical protein
MRQRFAFLSFLIIIVSCHNNKQVKEQYIAKLSPMDSLIEKFAPIINGDWVRADYVEDLKKTLSPNKSYHHIGEEEWAISIDSRNTSIDSAIVYISYGGAGSEEDVTFFEPGKVPNSILLENISQYGKSFQLGFEIVHNDTNLILYECDSTGKEISQRKYIRARNELTGNDTIPSVTFSNLSYYHNKLLISGKYSYVDSLGQKHNAEFNDFGKVTGIKNYKTYYVEGVFGQGPGDDTDAIYFELYTKASVDYLLRIYRDSLYLYTDTFNDSTNSYGKGKLVYKLIRQK